MAKTAFPLSKVYGLLEPGPVVLLTTAADGRSDVMTLSWHTMMEFEPPLVGCVVSAQDYSFELLQASEECVINIPTMELAEQVVGCGNTSGRTIDKFAAFGLTATAAFCVQAPLIEECYASLECRVADTQLTSLYNFFVLEVLKAKVDRAVENPRTLHHRGWGAFMVAGETITLSSAMK